MYFNFLFYGLHGARHTAGHCFCIFFGCFWFERSTIKPTVDFLGSQCVLFETDFPHPTCLYPRDDVELMTAFEGLEEADVRAILQDNAADLYRIDIS